LKDSLILSTEYRHILRVAERTLTVQNSSLRSKLDKWSKHKLRSCSHQSSWLSETVRLGSLSDSELQRLEEIIRDPGRFGVPSWLMNRQRTEHWREQSPNWPRFDFEEEGRYYIHD